jgi:hypothetical protein
VNSTTTKATPAISIVRENILTRPGYSPYCGAARCPRGWPRTEFKRDQFECVCGWRSQFEDGFVTSAREALTRSQP